YACWAADHAEPAERHRAATMAQAFAADELYGVGASLDQLTFGIDRGRRASRPCTFQKVSIAALCSLADALVRIGEYVADNGMMCNGPYQAARDLLMLAGPGIGGQALRARKEPAFAPCSRFPCFPKEPPSSDPPTGRGSP